MSHGSPLKYITTWTGVRESKVSVANQMHPEGITIRCAFTSVGIFGSVFVDGTVASEDLSLLSDEFVPFLMGYGISINLAWF
jgi:hypothetical protein